MTFNKNLHKALINNGMPHGVAVLLADPKWMGQSAPKKAPSIEDPAEKTTVAELRETLVELLDGLRSAGIVKKG